MHFSSPCRVYIVYRHGLFARGIRSMLDEQAIVQIVGMENDANEALKAVRSIKPDVIILEQAVPKCEGDRLAIFLQNAAAGRVVRLSLEDEQATVYGRRHVPAGNAGDLVKAIRGTLQRKQSHVSTPNPQVGKAAMGTRPEVGRNNNHQHHTGRGSRARRGLKEEASKPPPTPQPSRGKRKGG